MKPQTGEQELRVANQKLKDVEHERKIKEIDYQKVAEKLDVVNTAMNQLIKDNCEAVKSLAIEQETTKDLQLKLKWAETRNTEMAASVSKLQENQGSCEQKIKDEHSQIMKKFQEEQDATINEMENQLRESQRQCFKLNVEKDKQKQAIDQAHRTEKHYEKYVMELEEKITSLHATEADQTLMISQMKFDLAQQSERLQKLTKQCEE